MLPYHTLGCPGISDSGSLTVGVLPYRFVVRVAISGRVYYGSFFRGGEGEGLNDSSSSCGSRSFSGG